MQPRNPQAAGALKGNILKALDRGEGVNSVAARFGVPRTTVSGWLVRRRRHRPDDPYDEAMNQFLRRKL